MKEFNISEGVGEFIIHLNGDNSKYEVIYDHGQIIFQNSGLRYIIPENVGNKVTFLAPDPNTGKRTYFTDSVRSLYRDTTPTDFGLGSNITDVEVGSSHFTEEIVVGGINESIPVIAPAGVVIWINGIEAVSGSMVEQGDTIKFEITASTEYETVSNFNLSVGDITKAFSITTAVGVLKNCLAWRNAGKTANGLYRINPTGSNEFMAYCDMTTDGGGWTLVGKGRQGWEWNDAGQGNIDQVSSTWTSYDVDYYSSAIVNAILAKPLNQSTDGIKINRLEGLNQDVRWKFPSNTSFSWLFDSGSGFTVNVTWNGVSKGQFNTRDQYTNGSSYNDCSRIFTWAWSGHNYVRGFSTGSSCSSGWTYSTENHPIPMTQVWVRG